MMDLLNKKEKKKHIQKKTQKYSNFLQKRDLKSLYLSWI